MVTLWLFWNYKKMTFGCYHYTVAIFMMCCMSFSISQPLINL